MTRYNLEESLVVASESGAALGKAAEAPRPFGSLAELLSHYDGLKFACHDHVDEMIWLAEQAVRLGYSDSQEIRRLCAEAKAIRDSDCASAADKAVHAFELARGQL